jgi:hypothetical protein
MALFVSKRAKSDGREAVPPRSAAAPCCMNPEGVTLPLPPARASGPRRTRAALSPRMGAADNSPAFQRWVRTRPSEVKAPEGRQSPIRAAEAGFSRRNGARADCHRPVSASIAARSRAAAPGVCRPSGAKEGHCPASSPSVETLGYCLPPPVGGLRLFAQQFPTNLFLNLN